MWRSGERRGEGSNVHAVGLDEQGIGGGRRSEGADRDQL